jgi:hypothetical protein
MWFDKALSSFFFCDFQARLTDVLANEVLVQFENRYLPDLIPTHF